MGRVAPIRLCACKPFAGALFVEESWRLARESAKDATRLLCSLLDKSYMLVL